MINLDWDKVNGLIPAIIQDHETLEVLMLGYMNEEALKISQSSGFATFYSRTKQRLWTKGETSGNKLTIHKIIHDCDKDTLLILAKNNGPTCHLNNNSCFIDAPSSINFIELRTSILSSTERIGFNLLGLSIVGLECRRIVK